MMVYGKSQDIIHLKAGYKNIHWYSKFVKENISTLKNIYKNIIMCILPQF